MELKYICIKFFRFLDKFDKSGYLVEDSKFYDRINKVIGKFKDEVSYVYGYYKIQMVFCVVKCCLKFYKCSCF